ncbi:unnamed protein product [Mytilus edulis]|uniref:Endonuclease/exonuclease/phosphatase domain-containing protein n=1 Tax=Mytilus edulis TaxID=6550 RepID=A0A8S3UPR3_MYTED|nr:unnamed protein product [Mytilus edulis]
MTSNSDLMHVSSTKHNPLRHFPKIAAEVVKVPLSKKAWKQTGQSAKHPDKKSAPTNNKSPIIDVESDIHIDTELTPDTVVMTKMISKLSADMRIMFSDVNDRIRTLEEKLEQKLMQKFNQILDKRVNSESSKIRKDVNKIVDALRSDIDQDLKVVEDKLDGVSKTVGEIGSRATNPAQDISKNVIIRNLPEGRNENTKFKVAALFTEGLKIARIGTFNVERKINKSGRDGVVVVSCKSRDDRESILSAKNKLKVSRQYSNIYIHPDMTLQQRIESENMIVLAKTLKSVNPDLRVRGSRLVDESACSDSQSIAETYLKEDEVLIVNGFKWFGHNRNVIHKNAKCGSGGVGFLIKDYLTEIFDIGILDQSFEGILWLYLHHRLSNFRFNICVCYLPPDHSTRQVDKELFFDTLISQVYEFQNDGLFYICGDFNSRCGDEYDYIPGVDCINMRSVIDFTRNSYCTTFIDFLTSSNCCMLNGRVGTNNDFTCVSSKGQSVVDYCITSYENLHFFQDFKVIRASDLIIKSKLNMTGLDGRSIPDHSLLYCELNISASLPLCHTSGNRSPEFIKFDVKNIPFSILIV